MLFASYKDGFDVNGRFHGSAVVVMPKEERKNIEINGEQTMEIDIRNCIPFVLSASYLGKPLPGDVYDLDNVSRGAVKLALLLALNCKSKEQARRALQAELNSAFEEQVTAAGILEMLEESYPVLAAHFYSSVGTKLMRIESRCMERFMRRMLDLGIKHYPIYDSGRVPVSAKSVVKEELMKAFTINGIEPVLHEE